MKGNVIDVHWIWRTMSQHAAGIRLTDAFRVMLACVNGQDAA
jgi:hypothetical protein